MQISLFNFVRPTIRVLFIPRVTKKKNFFTHAKYNTMSCKLQIYFLFCSAKTQIIIFYRSWSNYCLISLDQSISLIFELKKYVLQLSNLLYFCNCSDIDVFKEGDRSTIYCLPQKHVLMPGCKRTHHNSFPFTLG